MKRILSYLVVAAAVILCAGTLSAQTSKTSAPVRYGWVSVDDFSYFFDYGFENVNFAVEWDPLYGDVESVEEFYYTFGDIDKNGYPKDVTKYAGRVVYRFNERGDVIEDIRYYGPSVLSHKQYEYNSSGLVALETEFNDDGDVAETTSYEYNSQGKLVKKTHTSSRYTDIYVDEYEYDARGNMVAKFISYDTGTNKTTYEYDSANRLIEAVHVESDDYSNSTVLRYSYDNKGRAEGCVVTTGGRVIRSHTYEYDSRGNISKIHYSYDSSSEEVSTRQLIYNANGKFCGFKDDDISMLFIINGNGRVVENQSVYHESCRTRYTHDAKGNIVMKRYNYMYSDCTDPIETYIRKINYRK